MAKKLNINPGDTFGHWEVIKEAPKKNNRRFWQCKCSCGTEKNITQSALVAGKSKSCGCSKKTRAYTDLTGELFGRLKVISKLDKKKNGRIMWMCECDCGERTDVAGIYLTTGETKSCGCLKAENEQKNLRDSYDASRVEGVVKPLFKGKEPRKDSATSYRGVSKYYTRKSKELRYRAWITVKGKPYYKAGFTTPEDAYYNGRLMLEEKHLPKKEKNDE